MVDDRLSSSGENIFRDWGGARRQEVVFLYHMNPPFSIYDNVILRLILFRRLGLSLKFNLLQTIKTTRIWKFSQSQLAEQFCEKSSSCEEGGEEKMFIFSVNPLALWP